MATKAGKKPVKKAEKAKTAPKLTTAQRLDAVGIDAICTRIADCKALHVIATEFEMSAGSLIVWLDKYPEHYARAKAAQADRMAEDILAIADEVAVTTKYDGEDVQIVMDSTAVARNRLRVDARKWLASKMLPKKYGDKVTQEHTGEGGGPVQQNITVSFVTPK